MTIRAIAYRFDSSTHCINCTMRSHASGGFRSADPADHDENNMPSTPRIAKAIRFRPF
jgi:hypothetical protein